VHCLKQRQKSQAHYKLMSNFQYNIVIGLVSITQTMYTCLVSIFEQYVMAWHVLQLPFITTIHTAPAISVWLCSMFTEVAVTNTCNQWQDNDSIYGICIAAYNTFLQKKYYFVYPERVLK